MKIEYIYRDFGLNDTQKEVIKDRIHDYVRIKCKEQRELCSKSFPSHEHPDVLQSVFNAPEPEFE